MRKKRVWRYWCDFCNKGGCSGGAMAKHEKHCTANPNRHCRVCVNADLEQQPIADLIAALGKGDKEGVDNLRDLAEGCPACMLSAIRQRKEQAMPPKDSDEYWEMLNKFCVDFNYRKESEAFWGNLNDARYQEDCRVEMY